MGRAVDRNHGGVVSASLDPDRVLAALRRSNGEVARLRAIVEDRAAGDAEIGRALDELEAIVRKAEGNPYHDAEGHFTGPGGVGHAAGKAPGKHHAKRQRRKARRAKRARKPGAAPKAGAAKEKAPAKAKAKGQSAPKREHAPNAKERADRIKKGKPPEYASEKARRAAESQNKTDKSVQDYTKANEHELAKKLGGESFPDNDPADVHVALKDGSTRGIELKTVTHGKNDKITMKASALARKADFQRETGRTMYTVIEDHRDTFAGGKNAGLYSGNRLYLRIGTGSYRISNMVPVKDYAELNRLVRMTPAELRKLNPKFAGDTRGTDR